MTPETEAKTTDRYEIWIKPDTEVVSGYYLTRGTLMGSPKPPTEQENGQSKET
jgi:hypothetical protein